MSVQIGHTGQEGAYTELRDGLGSLGFSRLPGGSVKR